MRTTLEEGGKLLVVAELVGLVTVPIFLFLAWKGWAKNVRREMPPWRNGICISALLVLSLNWLGAAALEAPSFLNLQTARPVDFERAMITLSHPLDLVVLVLALALPGVPRVQTVIAASLMLFSWPTGYV